MINDSQLRLRLANIVTINRLGLSRKIFLKYQIIGSRIISTTTVTRNTLLHGIKKNTLVIVTERNRGDGNYLFETLTRQIPATVLSYSLRGKCKIELLILGKIYKLNIAKALLGNITPNQEVIVTINKRRVTSISLET